MSYENYGERISNIYVQPVDTGGAVKAYASVHYMGVVLRGMKVVESSDSLWVSMPARKKGDAWEDVYFFADQGLKRFITEKIMEEYRRVCTEGEREI